jgi:hypothetical protein
MAKFSVHKLVLTTPLNSTTNFYFLAPDGQYEGLSAETGVSTVTANAEKIMPKCTVTELLKSPVAVRKHIRYTKAGRTHYSKIIVSSEKAATIETSLPGKAYNGGTVVDVYEPLRASFS